MSRLSRLLRRVFPRKIRLEAGGLEARFRIDCAGDLYIARHPDIVEREQKAAVLEALREDDVLYEIGAHIGSWTVFLAQRLARGEVHAFEPDGPNRKQLAANLALNELRNVSIHDCAISDRSGRAEFAVFAGERDARHSLVIADDFDRTIEVDTLRLDDVPERLGIPEPTALKIDVEGAEGLVLAGADSVLGRPALRLIYVELHARMAHTGWTRERVLERLLEVGFPVVERWTRDDQLHCLCVRRA